MTEQRICPKCQRANAPEARSCVNCHQPLTAEAAQEASLASPDKATTSSSQSIGEIKDGGVGAGIIENAPGGTQIIGGVHHYHLDSPSPSPAAPDGKQPLLRLTQNREKDDRYHIEIAFEDSDGSRLTADPRFLFKLEPEDYTDLRWYLEDYLQYPLDPAPTIAARIEERMAEIGTMLFKLVFQDDDDARELWSALRPKLDDARVEVVTDVAGAAAIPWELLHDARTEVFLALRARSFVRSYSKPVQKAYLPQPTEKVRVLLVICRPAGSEDVPFRSVAGQMLKGLRQEDRERFDLEVLRPPTYAQLANTLRAAKARGQPYHIVHFDGHGTYLDTAKLSLADLLRGLKTILLSGPRAGSHGYLLFESSDPKTEIELVDGPALGKLLVETDVPVLVLNACRSAHADLQTTPSASDDPHTQVRAFGSLAQEVMDAGAAGVVAMRYNVYVVTAAQFVADLYAALASGMTLGEAASLGRKQLAAQPLRAIAFEPRPLQDWPVPVVYEAASVRLLPSAIVGADGIRPAVTIDLSQPTQAQDALPRPEAGFFGRDETLLALDRAFDTQKIVLLHAYAGSGKTMTAAEFARWYLQTGGLVAQTDGLGQAVLFTAFTEYKPLARVLDTLEASFRPLFEQNNIQWLALSDQDKLNLTVQLFKQIPVLWIWDNVEPVAGFPAGTSSAWTDPEQNELKYFLDNMAAMTKAKFLLTSRRDEQGWLGELPARVSLPPMPLQEMVQLARALAEKRRARLENVDDWRPLLAFTCGNPLTLTALVGQALRDGLKTKEQVAAYAERLRAGQAAFDDEASEGRSKSLGASLSYGFERAFSEDERKVLALLHFFQGFVNVDALRWMGDPGDEWCLPEVRGLSREQGIALLDRAAEIGLLEAHGGGTYSIHPALPWFFNGYYAQYYGQREAEVERAFVEALGALGEYYMRQYSEGNREVIGALRAEEANLLHARRLALRQARQAAEGGKPKLGWWWAVISAMQGLDVLYDHTGRRAEWRRLVEEITPDFAGADDLPLPGREEQWSLVTQHRVLMAEEERHWGEAERLQRLQVEWRRQLAEATLAKPTEELSTDEKNDIRWVGASLQQLGDIQREQDSPECADSYQEAIPFLQRIGDRPAEAVVAFNLGHAYMRLPALRDLDAAEGWYRRSLELCAEGDRLGRAKCYSQLGLVARERFKDARQANAPEADQSKHLNTAAGYYHKALEFDPPDNPGDLAIDHNQLGNIYYDAGDLERALDHYNRSIHYKEMAGNIYAAGTTRRNIAMALASAGRFGDALLYARAALRNFEPYGQGAAQDIQDTQRLIAAIEEAMRGGG